MVVVSTNGRRVRSSYRTSMSPGASTGPGWWRRLRSDTARAFIWRNGAGRAHQEVRRCHGAGAALRGSQHDYDVLPRRQLAQILGAWRRSPPWRAKGQSCPALDTCDAKITRSSRQHSNPSTKRPERGTRNGDHEQKRETRRRRRSQKPPRRQLTDYRRWPSGYASANHAEIYGGLHLEARNWQKKAGHHVLCAQQITS